MSDYPLSRGFRSADPRPRLWVVALTTAVVGMILVAAAAFLLSYQGIHEIARQAGVFPRLAWIYPLMFDAMLVITGSAALALRTAGRWTRAYVWVSLLLVVGAAAAGDALHATSHSLTGQAARAAIAIIPWILLLMAFGILLAMLRQWRKFRAAAAASGAGAAGRMDAGRGAGQDQHGRITSDTLVFSEVPNRRITRQTWRSLAQTVSISAAIAGVGAMVWWNGHLALIVGLAAAAVFCFILGSSEMYWRNYSWWTPHAMENFAWPSPVPTSSARLFFSIVVPALNESMNIEATIGQLVRQDHPHFEVVVSMCSCDVATITTVRRAEAKYPDRVRSVIGDHREFRRHRKAYQLNRAIATVPTADKHIVLITDAEGGVEPTLLRHMEAVFREEGCDVVQGGVQLMNLGRWFQVFAATEYAAWFEGNMARQANQGVVLFGGNTVAFTTSHLARIGGIPDSLTEDGAAGIRSAMAGAKVAVCYSAELCTRELSPPTLFNKQLGSFFFQRVRWVQGYFHELIDGRWLKLPTWSQRRSAGFGLASPVLQSVSSLLLPLAIITALTVKVPLVLALAAFVPLVPYSLTVWAQAMHLANFGRRFQQKVGLRHYLIVIFLCPLYQVILLSASAVAVWRHVTGQDDWYKTGREHDQTEIALISAERALA